MMRKPKQLRPGDTIAVVSLSWGGPGAFPHRYAAGKQQLQDTFGVRVVEMRHTLRDPLWLAQNPQARAADLLDAFADPSIAGIISSIGGDDSIRLLPWLDLELIRANPKVFMGYSDTTVTHLACFAAGLVSFYGPAIMAGFAENGGLFPYMVESLRKTLFSPDPVGVVVPNRAGWTVEWLDWAVPDHQNRHRALQPSTGWRFLQGRGVVQGRLIGGCLEVLDWLRGTAVWPGAAGWQGSILFLETSEEAPSPLAVQRMLRNLGAVGVLQQIAALLVGRPGGALPLDQFDAYDAVIQQVLGEELGLTELPIITRMDFGHTDPMFVLPYGVLAQIDCERQEFALIESAVVA